MKKLGKAVTIAAVLGFTCPAFADQSSVEIGGDSFLSGAQVNETLDAKRDAFVAGRTLRLQGNTTGDLHVTGYDVSVGTETSDDLYAAGVTVDLRGPIGGDLSVAAFTLHTQTGAATDGNARILGNSVTLDGPVKGALLITGRDVIVNSVVNGDVRILAQTLSFGPNAQIGGTLTYSTQEKITVPDRVLPDARVVFEPVSTSKAWDHWDEVGSEMPGMPKFASVLFGFVISLLFFLTLGALFLTFMPRRLSMMRKNVAKAPGQTLLLGVIGLSMLFGMVPITALTIVGLLFAPVLVLAIVVAWILGYALGAYSVAMRIWSGFGGQDDPSTLARLLVFGAAITFIALLNYIPFVGWVANYTLVLLGIGGMTRALFQSLIGTPDAVLDVDMKPIEET